MDKKRLLPAILVVFVNLLGATVVIPILPLFAVDMLGGTVVQAVLLDSSYYAAKVVAAPILGRLSDKYGRRPLLIISQTGTVLSFILFSLAIPLGHFIEQTDMITSLSGGLIILYIARLLDGATGGNTIVAQAYVVDITDEEHRAQALGYLSAALGVGFIIGPAVGGLLAAGFGLMAPFLFGAIIAACGLLFTFMTLEESLEANERPSQEVKKAGLSMWSALSQPGFVHVTAVGFLTTLCFAAISPTFSLYAKRVLFDPTVTAEVVGRSVGLIFMLVGVVMVLTQGVLIRPLVRQLGEQRLLIVVQGILILTFFTIPTSLNSRVVAGLMIPLAFAYSVSDPMLQALVTKRGSADTHGQLLGAYHAVLSLSYLLGPLWAGVVFDMIAPQALWWVGALLLLPSLIFSIMIKNRTISLNKSSVSSVTTLS